MLENKNILYRKLENRENFSVFYFYLFYDNDRIKGRRKERRMLNANFYSRKT